MKFYLQSKHRFVPCVIYLMGSDAELCLLGWPSKPHISCYLTNPLITWTWKPSTLWQTLSTTLKEEWCLLVTTSDSLIRFEYNLFSWKSRVIQDFIGLLHFALWLNCDSAIRVYPRFKFFVIYLLFVLIGLWGNLGLGFMTLNRKAQLLMKFTLWKWRSFGMELVF